MSVITVYSWRRADTPVDAGPPVQPALRVWADVVLELLAEMHRPGLTPPISLRRGAVFAFLEPDPGGLTATIPADRSLVTLEVETDGGAAARHDLSEPVYSPQTWRDLREHLSGRGHPADLVEEEIVAVSAPMEPMVVARGREAVESTGGALLADLLSWFEPVALPYLDSWRPLDDLGTRPHEDGVVEVVVPPGSVLNERGPIRPV